MDMKVDVYVNLKKGGISVRSRETEDYGIVVAHRNKVSIRDPKFVVQESGRDRCRRLKKKNVHAFVRGKWDDSITIVDGDYVTYNPFRHDHFYSPDLDSYVSSADAASVSQKGVFARGLSEL